MNIFDIINDIGYNKEYLFSNGVEYNIYITNKAFGQHLDTIMLANEMNKRPNLSKEMHHDFLFYGIDAKKRFGKWAKAEQLFKPDVIEYIKEKYSIGEERAIEYLNLMDNKNIKDIEKQLKTKEGRIK